MADLPQEALDVLDAKFGDDAGDELPPVEEPSVDESAEVSEEITEEEPPQGDEEVVEASEPAEPKSSNFDDWNRLQVEAKDLGINPKGMNKSDLNEAIESHKSRLSGIREELKSRGLSEDFYSEASPAELQRMQRALDAVHLRQQIEQRKQLEELDRRWREHFQRQQPQQPPQNQPVDLNALKDQYGEDDPLFQAAMQYQQQASAIQRQQQELQARLDQQQRQAADQQMRQYRSMVETQMKENGLEELLTYRHGEAPPQDRVIQAMVQLAPVLRKADGSYPADSEMIERGIQAVFGHQLQQQQQAQRASRQQASGKKRLGTPTNSRPRRAVPGEEGDWEPRDDDELRKAFADMEESVA